MNPQQFKQYILGCLRLSGPNEEDESLKPGKRELSSAIEPKLLDSYCEKSSYDQEDFIGDLKDIEPLGHYEIKSINSIGHDFPYRVVEILEPEHGDSLWGRADGMAEYEIRNTEFQSDYAVIEITDGHTTVPAFNRAKIVEPIDNLVSDELK
jgi:hypothetical protein